MEIKLEELEYQQTAIMSIVNVFNNTPLIFQLAILPNHKASQ